MLASIILGCCSLPFFLGRELRRARWVRKDAAREVAHLGRNALVAVSSRAAIQYVFVSALMFFHEYFPFLCYSCFACLSFQCHKYSSCLPATQKKDKHPWSMVFQFLCNFHLHSRTTPSNFRRPGALAALQQVAAEAKIHIAARNAKAACVVCFRLLHARSLHCDL